jgi:hypothetical protein
MPANARGGVSSLAAAARMGVAGAARLGAAVHKAVPGATIIGTLVIAVPWKYIKPYESGVS